MDQTLQGLSVVAGDVSSGPRTLTALKWRVLSCVVSCKPLAV